MGPFRTPSQRRQKRSDDCELEAVLVAVAVGTALEDADHVVELLHQAEADLVLGAADGTRYATRAGARTDLFDYIEVFYNRSRRHSMLGYQSPIQFLQGWIKTQHERIMAA